MILDTNAISALLDGNDRLGGLLGKLNSHHLPLGVLAEYLFGLRSSKRGTRLKSLLRKLEAESEILYPDRETIDWYVTIRHDLKRRGTPIPEVDLWVAALARQHNLSIVSQDQHFDLVPKVRRLSW